MQNRHRFKHTRVADKVIEDNSLKGTDKAVYMALSYFASNKSSECYPSRDTLMRVAGISDKTLRNAISNLKEKGYISVKHRTVKGKRASNIYRLL